MRTIDILEKLFGGASKVKIMRLFLFNPKIAFDIDEICHRSKITPAIAKKDLGLLEDMGMLLKKDVSRVHQIKRGKKVVEVSKKVAGWKLDEKFKFLVPLQTFLVETAPVTEDDLADRFSKAGKVKLLVTSGVFNQFWDARVDLLVVGDHLKKVHLENAIKNLESEVGKELVYTVFETDDFLYRLGVCDKLVRDILDYPHQKVINRLNIA